MISEIASLLEQHGIAVKQIDPVPNTHLFNVWLTVKFHKKEVVKALKQSAFECYGGGIYHGKPLAIIARKVGL